MAEISEMESHESKTLKNLWELIDGEVEKGGIHISKLHNAKTVYCFSDYAGDNAKHNIYSFLFIDWESSQGVRDLLVALRDSESAWNDKSWMQYKKMNKDAVRRRILPHFLTATDNLVGNLFVVSIEKAVDNLISPNGAEEAAALHKELEYGEISPHIAQRKFDIHTIKSILASRLVTINQNYVWISDPDSTNYAGQNPDERWHDFLKQSMLLFDVKFKSAAFGTTRDYNIEDNFYGDMLSIPDLVCGAVLELLEQPDESKGLKETTIETLNWFRKKGEKLARIHIHFRDANGTIGAKIMHIIDSSPNVSPRS